ncbi:MAG: ABC transporter ATP-binding protein [Caldilineaceae bacterium]
MISVSRTPSATLGCPQFALILIDTSGQLLSLIVTFACWRALHWLTVPLLLLTCSPQLIAQALRSNTMFKLWTGRTPVQRMVYYIATLLSKRDPVKEVRLFGLQVPFLQRYRAYTERVVEENKALVFRYERINLLTVLLSVLGVGLVWGYAIIQATQARITIGDLALVFQAAEQVRSGLNSLFYTLGMFYEHSLFVGNLYRFLELDPLGWLGHSNRKATNNHYPFRPLQQGIAFRNVSFRYPNADRDVLQNVSFTIVPIRTVAVVGENGAGKTTLIKLFGPLL